MEKSKMQVGTYVIKSDWQSFEDVIGSTPTEVKYQIQNRGAYDIYLLESETVPDEVSLDGNILKPFTQAIYQKDSPSLYIKSVKSSTVNVSSLK